MPTQNAIQLPAPILNGDVTPRQRVKLSVKQGWADDWTEAPYLEALSATEAVAPSVPSARFRWRCGEILSEGQTAYESVPPIDVRDWFVRIELLGQPSAGSRPATQTATLFVGRFVEQDLELGGEDPEGERATPGDQEMVAYGLAYELDRYTIDSSVITNDNENGGYVNVALTFNENYVEGFSEVGNRSAAVVTVDEAEPKRKGYAFANTRNPSDPSKGYAWSLRNILDYLIKFQGGLIDDEADGLVPMFTLSGGAGVLEAIDTLVYPNVRVDGLTVLQVLNELLDRRRGLGWCVRLDENEKAQVHVFTTIGEPLAIADGASFPANSEATDLTVRGLGHLIRSQQFSLTAGQRYDRIRVTGEPLLVCFSLSFEDATLQIGWDADGVNPYKRARGSGTTDADNDMERGDDRWRHVYARYIVPPTWDGRAGDGEGGAKTNVNVGFFTDGRLGVGATASGVVETPNMRNWGKTFLRTIPVRTRTPTASDREPEYRPLLALVYRDPPEGSGGGAEGLYLHADLADLDGGQSANVRPLDRELGVEVRLHPNHILAKNHYTISAGDGSSTAVPLYDYEKMILTVAMRTDERMRVVVDVEPLSATPNGTGGIRRTLEIRVPRAECWYVLHGTVTGIENGQPKRDKRGAQERIVRDDSAQLRRVAAMAKAWYGTERSTMAVTFNEVTVMPVGTYVRTVVEADPSQGAAGGVPGEPWRAPVNSVVTQLTHDLQAMRTTVRTHYEELDGTEAARQCPGYTIR